MNILFIGDLFGDVGRRVLADNLEEIKKEYGADITIVNGENCSGGKGITLKQAKKLRKYGADIITGGNHSHAEKDVFEDPIYKDIVIRPANIKSSNFRVGKGLTYFTLPNSKKVAIINLMGNTFIKGKRHCPFKMADTLVEKAQEETNIIFIDFHAETTSEKVCLAHHLNGRVSAIVGTHTHVQTNDARIFSNGTAFITDAGMTGAEDSAIGMDYRIILDKILNGNQNSFKQSKDGPMINGVIISIDDESGKAVSIDTVFRRY